MLRSMLFLAESTARANYVLDPPSKERLMREYLDDPTCIDVIQGIPIFKIGDPVEILTDGYVSGRFDIVEFERRVTIELEREAARQDWARIDTSGSRQNNISVASYAFDVITRAPWWKRVARRILGAFPSCS